MAVGKGSIMRASNAVKDKKTESKEIESSVDVSDEALQNENGRTASFAVFDGNQEKGKTKEVLWIPVVELNTATDAAEMTQQEESALESSLAKYGFLTPLIVWKRKSGRKEELVVLDGLKRLKMAKKMNIKEAPVIVAQVETAAQAEEIQRELHVLVGSKAIRASYRIEQGIASQLPVYLL